MHYEYCPQCGTKLIQRSGGDDGMVPFCEPCNRYWFDSFSTCVIILVANEFDEIALLRQSYLSDQYASFVAGYMTPGEDAEIAAIREVKEEIGVDVERIELAGTYWFEKGEKLMIGFIAHAKKGELILSDEVDSASWVPAKDVPKYLFPESPDNAAYAIYRKYMESEEEYTYKETKEFSKEELEELFLSVNWVSGKYPEKLVKAMHQSSKVISAWDGDKLIGLVRAIDDGVTIALIHYLLVNPAYQGKHIGDELMKRLLSQYEELMYVKVIPSDPKTIPFYKRYGFKEYDNYSALVMKHFE